MRSPLFMLFIAFSGLFTALPSAAQSGFDYLASRKFACRLDASHQEIIFVDFDFGPDKTVTGKMGIAAWVNGTPYTQVYDVSGRTDRFGENTYKVYIENYTRVSSDQPPAGQAWASRYLDEFTLHDANGNRLSGRHTTVTASTGYNSSTRLIYDSNCSEHRPGT